MIGRRGVVAAGAGAVMAPSVVGAQGGAACMLRVIQQANLTSLDPVWTTAAVTRNHAFMIYDQL